jgi:hypothetical protein
VHLELFRIAPLKAGLQAMLAQNLVLSRRDREPKDVPLPDEETYLSLDSGVTHRPAAAAR